MKLSPNIHRLLITTLYFLLFVFILLNHIPTGFGSGLMLFLDITALTGLGIAAIHGVTVNILKLKNENLEPAS